MSMTQTLAPHLPYLRRYARALTGSQNSGDAHVRAALTALLAESQRTPLCAGAGSEMVFAVLASSWIVRVAATWPGPTYSTV